MISRLLVSSLVYFLWITSSTAQFFNDGLTVRDVRNGVNWLRCTVGQTWNYDTEKCEGEIVKLNHTEIEQARKQASEQLGGTWRLPTLDELESLVCENCEKPKINEKYFPGISPEAYWTQTKNRLATWKARRNRIWGCASRGESSSVGAEADFGCAAPIAYPSRVDWAADFGV